MSPEHRTDFEVRLAAHAPSIDAAVRERLLFESARELGRQQGRRQVVRQSATAAVVSCGLTLLISWTLMLGRSSHDGELTPGQNAAASGGLAVDPTPSQTPRNESVAQGNPQPGALSRSDTIAASGSRFDSHILTPVSWSARRDLSYAGQLRTDTDALFSAEQPQHVDASEAERFPPNLWRAGMPVEHF